MTSKTFTEEDLRAYLDESLSVTASAELEQHLRSDVSVQQRLHAVMRDLDAGGLTLGDVWRRRRLSCPPRSTWAAYLSGQLGDGYGQYLRIHLETVGCRLCAANLADLQVNSSADDELRVRKIFATSVGRLATAR